MQPLKLGAVLVALLVLAGCRSEVDMFGYAQASPAHSVTAP